jgi:hypothetical protein
MPKNLYSLNFFFPNFLLKPHKQANTAGCPTHPHPPAPNSKKIQKFTFKSFILFACIGKVFDKYNFFEIDLRMKKMAYNFING